MGTFSLTGSSCIRKQVIGKVLTNEFYDGQLAEVVIKSLFLKCKGLLLTRSRKTRQMTKVYHGCHGTNPLFLGLLQQLLWSCSVFTRFLN